MYSARKEKFVVEAAAFDIGTGESRDLSEHIQNINVRKDFVGASLPLVVVNIMTTQEYRDFMRDNEISLRLKVSKYNDVNEENEQDAESITIDEIVFDSVIRPYQKPYLSTASKTEEDNEDINNQGDSVKVFPYQIVGIPESLVQKNKAVVNQIYSNAKVDEVLVNILSGVERGNIFIDPSDNVDREENLIIPPMNLIPAIKYIQEVYGIYNSGLSIFFDFDTTYITKLFAQSREYQNTLEILSVSGNDNTTDISYISNMIDENRNVRLNLEVPPAFISNQSINEDYVGQTTVFNSYDYNFNPVRRIYDDNSDNGKTRYFWNNYQNKLFEESYLNQTLRSSEAISVNLSSINPHYFNRNTLYQVQTNNEYVNGEYNLVEMSYTIYTQDFKSFDSMVNLKLSKK